MAGESYLNDDGETLIDDDGNTYTCDECPCGPCPSSFDVTLSGCDASMCTNCHTGWNRKTASLSVDGTYNVPFSTTTIGDDCVFATTISGSYGTHDEHGNSSCTSYNSTSNMTGLQFEIIYDPDTAKITSCVIRTVSDGPNAFGGEIVYNTGISVDLDAAISTARTCSQNSGGIRSVNCDGGTATVSLP